MFHRHFPSKQQATFPCKMQPLVRRLLLPCVLNKRRTLSTSRMLLTSPGRDFRILRQQQEHIRSRCASSSSSMEESNNDLPEEQPPKRLSDVLIRDVLKAKHAYRWVDPVIHETATVREAITYTVEGGLSGMMVLREDKVVGLLSSRDLLRILASGLSDSRNTAESILQNEIGTHMTPIRQVIYARPDETVGMCRAIMAKLGLKCLPILEGNQVKGLVTAKDMSDYGLKAIDKGGKEAYLQTVSSRVGLSSNTTSMADPPQYLRAHLALEQSPLYINIGTAALPHPFKMEGGRVARDMRGTMAISGSMAITSHGAKLEMMQGEGLSSDIDLSEDSMFVCSVELPDEHNGMRPFTYLGVADGVGSWREYDVDPRHFSRRLMQECENILLEATAADHYDSTGFRQVISPASIMAQAHERVKADNVIGSCTACVALFDGARHQLHFSNLGDSGLIVLRHIDSDVAGALRRDRRIPRTERTSDLKITFVSQQQLRSFNHPYQLGWTGEELPENEESSFREARESCTSSIHLRRGDIVILATDGLFDNVDMDELCALCLEWEQQNGFIRSGDIAERERRWSLGGSLADVSAKRIGGLAETLVQRARELSLDRDTETPFSVLAKENDVMWSGGMPDDCTCIAMHITGVDGNAPKTE